MNRVIHGTALLSAMLLMTVGCQQINPFGKPTRVAVAHVKPAGIAATEPSYGNVTGTVTFEQYNGKVKVIADLRGVPPGRRGFHIHEKGDLSAPDLTSAGDHYNPEGHPHGPPGDHTHAGDLGNIEAGPDGRVKYEVRVRDISIGGRNDILGRSVIIHAKEDDLETQPTGDAGPRIAGGIIELKEKESSR